MSKLLQMSSFICTNHQYCFRKYVMRKIWQLSPFRIDFENAQIIRLPIHPKMNNLFCLLDLNNSILIKVEYDR